MGRHGIILNPVKFQFYQKENNFAGFGIMNKKVEPVP